MKWIGLLALLSMASMCKSPQSGSSSGPSTSAFDKARAMKDLQMFAAEPHELGSARNALIANYIDQEMKSIGLTIERIKFDVEVPDPELLNQDASMMRKATLTKSLENVTATYKSSSAKACVYLLGSHYDSKRLSGVESVGANDSGSSSAALMEIMRSLKTQSPSFRCHVKAIWFDGEEAYLPNWRDGESRHPANQIDNTYGSRFYTSSLKACDSAWCTAEGDKVEGLILLDMVGEANLTLSDDINSTQALRDLAKAVDQSLFKGELFRGVSPKGIEDDHIPFLRKNIPAIDLIGFENTSHWHQPTDTFDKIDADSLLKVGQLTDEMLKRLLL